jgi:ribonuclease HII
MCGLHGRYPVYGFDVHKGYVTSEHQSVLAEHGPCPEHRRRFVNVRRAENGTLVVTAETASWDGVAGDNWPEPDCRVDTEAGS